MANISGDELLDIDGSALEGGGQILRMATALSVIMGKPIRVSKIRAGRGDKPGLKAQHLAGLELVRDFSGGTLKGGRIGSMEIVFQPGKLTAGKYIGNISTAGSVSLLLQVSLPCLIFANGPSGLILKGGTNVPMAPTIDYVMQILQPILELFGIKFTVDLHRRGFFPKGRGEVNVVVDPLQEGYIKPIELLDRGIPTKITGLAYSAGLLPLAMTHNMADCASSLLRSYNENLEVQIERKKLSQQQAFGDGSGLFLVAKTSTNCVFGSSIIGTRGLSDESMGSEAAEKLIKNLQHTGCVDDHLQDQLIIFMALANGKSRIRCGPLTLHTQTAIHVAELMTKAKFKIIEGDNPNDVIIECDGHGLKGPLC